MTVIRIPVTTYSIRKNKPTQPYGSPAEMPLKNDESRILARISLDAIPLDAVISSAILRVFTSRAFTGTALVQARDVTSPWKASVTWSGQPTVAAGAALSDITFTNPPARQAYDLVVTTWATTRSRRGLRIGNTAITNHWLSGSAASRDKPVLIVTYTIPPDKPGALVPNGGAVSVPSPILTYAGDEDMTEQRVEFSNNGGASVTFSGAWHTATEGRYLPSANVGSPALAQAASTMWRVQTRGPNGTSVLSEWANYSYYALPATSIVNPGTTSPDGSPPLSWTTSRQTSYKAELFNGTKLLSSSGWNNLPLIRDWTPDKGIPVPGGTGLFELILNDDVIPRVAAENAPTKVRLSHTFSTTLTGSGTSVNTMVATFNDPIPVFTGSRSVGTPDEVALFRNGVQVPIWDSEGNVYLWAPGIKFFNGTTYSIYDYSADLRTSHSWTIRTRVNGAISAAGPTVTQKYLTRSVWLVNPRTNVRIEILGYNEEPAVDQETIEQSILHVPINGGQVVEPKRRRLMRTTRAGTISGMIQNADEDIFNAWILEDSGNKYRLIFGKVNWSVIIGDYDPVDLAAYPKGCGPDQVLFTLNWWERLADA